MAELRKNGSVTKGIALTGYGMEEDVARSRDAGFVAHLTKPVSIQSLETALNAVADS
jgi:CheY-like chemotaxis protein